MTAWPDIPLGEVLSERQEKPSFNKLLTGEIPIIAKIRFNDGQIELREDGNTKTNMILVRPGDLVLSGINAVKGAIAIHDEENDRPIAATIHYSSYFPREDRADVRFLWWILRSDVFREALKRHLPGGIKTELKAKRFLPIPIPIPPIEEQHRIVAHIEALEEKVDEVVRLRQKAVDEVERILGSELERLYKNGEIAGWDNITVGDITKEIRYGTSAKANLEPDGIPVLRMGNIQNGKLDLQDLKYMYPTRKELEQLRLKKGDILVNRTNSAELVGKCAVFEQEGDYLFASYIIRLRINQTRALPHYVANYINSPAGRAYMFAERKQMTGQANINSKKLSALPILLPELEEQHRNVSYLDELRAKVAALRALQSETQEALDLLLPSILDRAFKGELSKEEINMPTLLERLVEFEADVRYQEYATQDEPEFDYLPGTIPILVSAPHGAAHHRNGKCKEEDEFTASFARLIAAETGAHCIYARRKSKTDPNSAKDAPYKRLLRQICDEKEIRFVIDLHGMASYREAGLALGTRENASCTKQQQDMIIQSLRDSGFTTDSKEKLSRLWVNDKKFSGIGDDSREPVVKFVSENLSISTAQLEINGENRIVKRKSDATQEDKDFSGNPEMIERTVRAFIDLVNALNQSFQP